MLQADIWVVAVSESIVEQISVTHDVPSQLASLDLLNSEEIDGNTCHDKQFLDVKKQE